ncbi:DUF397 domain-containing protein [Nocardiopsis mangrovi]|uniref:DUF397 domain-containing protein n=1 Tax=Nocardiopsis mangrovi TaxID=1179818 RepID=A0ABV9DTR2_9ACTN
MNWHKSTYSGGNHPNCVEVAETSERVHIRDTRNRDLGALAFPASEWRALLADIDAL